MRLKEIRLAVQRTLTIVKPDGVRQGNIGDVIKTFEENKFKIVGMKMLHLTKKQAEGFYAVHSARPFFDSLTTFMSSGPVVVMVPMAPSCVVKLKLGMSMPSMAVLACALTERV